MGIEDLNTLNPGQFRVCTLPLERPGLPPPGEVHLWYLDLRRLASPLQHQGGAASRHMSPRRARTMRRFYLRLLLGAYLQLPGKDVVISRPARGKPLLDGGAHGQTLDFSMAGSDACCLVGLSTHGLVGVDLEAAGRRTRDPVALARRYFSADEADALAALDASQVDRAFLRTWACKEAVVKAAGLGIANQLCRFSVSADPDSLPGLLQMKDDDPLAWRLALVQPAESQIGAVALRHRSLRVRGFRLEQRAPGTPAETVSHP